MNGKRILAVIVLFMVVALLPGIVSYYHWQHVAVTDCKTLSFPVDTRTKDEVDSCKNLLAK